MIGKKNWYFPANKIVSLCEQRVRVRKNQELYISRFSSDEKIKLRKVRERNLITPLVRRKTLISLNLKLSSSSQRNLQLLRFINVLCYVVEYLMKFLAEVNSGPKIVFSIGFFLEASKENFLVTIRSAGKFKNMSRYKGVITLLYFCIQLNVSNVFFKFINPLKTMSRSSWIMAAH